MYKYTCKKCGCHVVYVELNDGKSNIRCIKCNTFIGKCAEYKEVMKISEKVMKYVKTDDKLASKRTYVNDKHIVIYCSKCKTSLYDSAILPNENIVNGYNLINAKYCPECGRRLF